MTIFVVKETKQEIDWDDYNVTMISYNRGVFSLFEIEEFNIDEFHE